MLTRLLNAKPGLQSSIKEAPKKFPHLDANLKRKELMEGKLFNHNNL